MLIGRKFEEIMRSRKGRDSKRKKCMIEKVELMRGKRTRLRGKIEI